MTTRHHYADRPCPNCGEPLDVTPGTRDTAECVPCTLEHLTTRRPADD